jgi:hypothetical protein
MLEGRRKLVVDNNVVDKPRGIASVVQMLQ